MINLAYGLRDVIPDNATGAFGARLIVSQDGWVDFLPDRVDTYGDKAFLDVLNTVLPIPVLKDVIASKLQAHEIDTRKERLVTIFVDDNVSVVANTNGSAGYLYLSAWSTT